MAGGDIIKELMDERGVTNAQLAERLGVTQATMWARLNNKTDRDMQLYTFCEMANALDYEVVIRPRHQEYVGGTERIAEFRKVWTPERRGRPRKNEAK